MREETARDRQSRVIQAGNKWEEYVRLFLNEKLQGTGLEVIYGKSEAAIKERNSTLWRFLSLPIKASVRQEHIWGDIDLVAVKDELPVAIISCKLSLHGRFTETLFWSLLFRILTPIKVVLATPDAGRGARDKWESEWGTVEKATKDRLLAGSYLHGVYVENVEAFCKNMKQGQSTVLGGIVRPLSELPEDLKRWTQDTSKFSAPSKNVPLL